VAGLEVVAAVVVGDVGVKMGKKIYLGIAIICLVLIGAFFFTRGGSFTGEVIYEESQIKIPLSEVSKTARFYEYDSNGVGIEFFVVKSDKGEVKTAFNACDVCFRAKKGYRQDGEDMICNNCGNHYAIEGLGTQNLRGGGCWPGYLPSTVEGEYLIIQKFDLDNGRYRF
jgi:uncharacterized membrane protein